MAKEVIEKEVAKDRDLTVLSQQDSAIANIVAEQPAVDVAETLFSKDRGVVNILELPEECRDLHKKQYRFKWLSKDRNLSAKLRLGPWILCTRSNAPFIKTHRYGLHGAVEQAGMLLAFTTERIAKMKEMIPQNRSQALVKHYTEDIQKMPDFYKPQSSGNSEEDDDVEKTGEIVEGKDF